MPYLIAMIIVITSAIIYMFNTFGGIGNKIVAISQKTSVLTEIYNIKSGINLALRQGKIKPGTTLKDLATLQYFAKEINEQLVTTSGAEFDKFKDTLKKTNYPYLKGEKAEGELVYENTYCAISFKGRSNPSMLISLVTGGGTKGRIPGLRVQFISSLNSSKAFLEKQISTDLKVLALVDRGATWGDFTIQADDTVRDNLINPPSSGTNALGEKKTDDGIFTIYFKDLDGRIN